MEKLLVIRFSALGDVALTVPVIVGLLEQYPNKEIYFVGKPFAKFLFPTHARFHFIAADLKGAHKGVWGLWRLSRQIRRTKVSRVVDLHGVLRTFLLCFFIAKPFARIDKDRKVKRQIVNKKAELRPLKHTTERYLKVFEELGLTIRISGEHWLTFQENPLGLRKRTGKFSVGIAPFAAHESKEWGIEKVRALAETLINRGNDIYFFGGGAKECQMLEQIAQETGGHNLSGTYSLNEELSIIQELNVFVSMDSANMHLATLVGTKVVSIWGPTHPFLGFWPLNNEAGIVQVGVEELPCRPCSVYGKIKSAHEHCARLSMDKISVEMVLDKVLSH